MSAGGKHVLTVALAGNPNVGKTTLFNALTGLRQHTGNWPGKTVEVARGNCRRGETEYTFVDLPGTYSLDGHSQEEQVASAYLAAGEADCTVVVCDGSCLERSLLLALQVLQRTQRVVVCVNLMDEANRHGVVIDARALARQLDAPVVLAAAGRERGLEALLRQISQTAAAPEKLRLPQWEDPMAAAERMVKACTQQLPTGEAALRQRVDRLLVSRRFGVPLLWLTLFLIVWLTVWGANYPGQLLEALFDRGYRLLSGWLQAWPAWLRGGLLDGMYSTCARVLAVMLPPMAIFFPLFTVLEDVGYLPRMAFLLDPWMARCGGCGKQALTLCMGLGCNAVGVMGCRILDTPRERLAAALTNAMVPCNGRFPTLILLAGLFFPRHWAAVAVALCVALGVVGAATVSGMLRKTCLGGEPGAFVMEMPPFRRPRLGRILLRSLLDRTLGIALRALYVAAPAGLLVWLGANTGLLTTAAQVLEPVGRLLGMNGVLLLAFVCSLPANELLIPVVLLAISGAGSLQVAAGLGQQLLTAHMTWQTALCAMVFTVFHWPCATTLMSIYRETRSIKNTAAAFALPTAVGCLLCIALRLLLQYLGL